MTLAPSTRQSDVLTIDVGATYIKCAHVSASGEVLDEASRTPTPYPCSPDQLVATLSEFIEQSSCAKVAVGFPGEFVDGVVLEPGNLSRSGGITTDVDPSLHQRWRHFELQRALCDSTRRDVRVVNDATLAALGCSRGVGREFVVTLGTGFGIALVVDGKVVRIRDVGAEILQNGRTYDELLGEPARRDDEARWKSLLHTVVLSLAQEISADTVHLGGGNAHRVTPDIFEHDDIVVVLHDNDAPLRGGAILFFSPIPATE